MAFVANHRRYWATLESRLGVVDPLAEEEVVP